VSDVRTTDLNKLEAPPKMSRLNIMN